MKLAADLMTLRNSKSQIANEYCYRYMERKPDAQVFWVYGGSIARFVRGINPSCRCLAPCWRHVLKLTHIRRH